LEFELGDASSLRCYSSRLVPEAATGGKVAFVLCIVNDVTERRRAEDALRASEERLARGQRAAHTGTWDWNVVTGESTWTEEAWLLFGREPFSSEVTFDLWLACIHPDDQAGARRRVEAALAAGPSYRDEFRILHADGHVTLLETLGEVVRDAAGKAVRVVGTVRDITERRAAEMALQRAFDESRRAVNAREKLVSLVSHDLRTPLHALHLGIALLGRDEGSNSPTLARMRRQAERMERIIDELLDVAQLHAGTPLQLVRQETDLLALIRLLVAEHQERSPNHAITLSHPAEAVVGHWDARRLERVINNLLSNATKYSPRGGTIAVVVALASDTGAESVVLEVKDEGIGIAPSEQSTIFDWYARAENAKRTSIQGTGIGLAGVKDIVLQHGGSITVDSSLGRGSVFRVSLPTRPRATAPELRSSPRTTDENDRGSAARQPS
jgi:signal transduction histidine kinase